MSKRYRVWRKEPYGSWEAAPHKPAVLAVAAITAEKMQLVNSEVKVAIYEAGIDPNKEGH